MDGSLSSAAATQQSALVAARSRLLAFTSFMPYEIDTLSIEINFICLRGYAENKDLMIPTHSLFKSI